MKIRESRRSHTAESLSELEQFQLEIYLHH